MKVYPLIFVSVRNYSHFDSNEILMSQGRKKSWPDRDSNPGPLPVRETTELLSQWPTFDILRGENVTGYNLGI